MAGGSAPADSAAVDANEPESELSDVQSPSGANEPEEEIIVGADASSRPARHSLPAGNLSQADETMANAGSDEPVSHYPKRKRTSIFNDLSESKIEIPTSIRENRTALPSFPNKPKPRSSLGGVKGVLVGHWRDSVAKDDKDKHAVIGFIDVRDRLRTRIQPVNKNGDSIAEEYPLPPGPGGSWVTFDRIHFVDHLIGLDHYQVKEYVRLRSAAVEDTEEERIAAETEAVKIATQRGRELLQIDNPIVQPLVAQGAAQSEPAGTPTEAADSKRRRTSTSFVSVATQEETPLQSDRDPLDPLHGTRPTRIVIGYWKGSSEQDPRDRHAVYGILGQNDMFRVKVVRETRDGRYVDGNFPSGAGALWIQYDEVEFEPHIKHLTRPETKEYCRIRQYQLDHGESSRERADNEAKAAAEAKARAVASAWQSNQQAINHGTLAKLVPRDSSDAGSPRGHELRQPRRSEVRSELRTESSHETSRGMRMSLPDDSRIGAQGMEAVERANALARREISRAEAAQGRADRQAEHRERVAAAAADAAHAAAIASGAGPSILTPPTTNGSGRNLFHESEDIERLNRVWARQESLRMRAGSEDAKMYDGVKYERKPTGPFMGKLVSQGTIITIDGEDYVEYRVLTKPSFF